MNFPHSFLSKLDILCFFLNYKTSKNIYFYFKNFKLFHFLIAYNFHFFFNFFFTITSYNNLSPIHIPFTSFFFALNLYNMLPYFFSLIYLIILYHFFTSQKLNDLSLNENLIFLFIYNPKVILVFLSLVFCFYFFILFYF